ncbi:transcriptional regulator with XRE-family HTH domain [Nocardia sp. GAS34]|uniref:helix-turn-helix domain-containing protein n=1 Tax=unclassified Nocardia TaxID=2637762 RepID=UPI003D2184E9
MKDSENWGDHAEQSPRSRSGRASGNARPSPDVEVSVIADYLKLLRDERHWSRPQVSALTGVSWHQIRQVERGIRNATSDVVEKLIAAYQLSPAQARYTRELLMPALPLPHLPGLRAQVRQTPHLVDHLTDLADRGVLGVCVDPSGSILASNTPMDEAFPGLAQAGNVMRWWFSPAAAPIVVDWDARTDLVVALFKAAIARHRCAPEVTDLIRDLSRSGAFLWPWVHSTRVVYTCPTDAPLRLRRPSDGAEYAVVVHRSDVDSSGQIRRYALLPLDSTSTSPSSRPPSPAL